MLTRKTTHICFVDFRKAFDVTDRGLLLYRLAVSGITGTVLSLIDQMYQNTTNILWLNGQYGDEFKSENSLRQGDNLSPTLFGLYINSLITELKQSQCGVSIADTKVCCLAYADDIMLIGEDAWDLQEMLDILNDWCTKWRVMINVNKTKVMHIRKKTVPRCEHVLSAGGIALGYVNQYKYLGVLMDEHLSLDPMVDQLSEAGSHALGQIIGKTHDNFDLGYSSFTKNFESCMAPVLDYSSGSWATGNDFTKLDSVQLRASHFYCSLPKNTPIVRLINEMAWVPGVVCRDLECVRLYNQLVQMPPTCLNRHIFQYERNLNNVNGWSGNISWISESVGMSDNWNDFQPLPIKVVKRKLLELYEETLAESIN